jgi:hypothetical protein
MAKQSDGVKKQSDSDQSGADSIDHPGIDNPGNSSTKKGQVGQSGSSGQGISMLDQGKTIFNNSLALQQQAPKITAQDDIPYGNPPAVMSSDSMKLSDVNDMFAPNKDIPTIAGNNDMTKLPELAMKVDPQMMMQKLPQMLKKTQKARDIMNSAGGVGMGGGGSGGMPQMSDGNSGTVEPIVTEALSGALSYLSNKLGFPLVIEVLYNALKNNEFYKLSTDHQKQVKNAIAILLKKASIEGPDTLEVDKFVEPAFGPAVPPNIVNSYEEVPDGYITVYYNEQSEDPFPGYIQYNDPSLVQTTNTINSSAYSKIVWTKRTELDYFYSSSSEQQYSTAEISLSNKLEPYFVQRTLTAEILDIILGQTNLQTQEQGQNDSLGKGSGKNGGNNNQMQQLLGQLQGILSMFKQQLPTTVLNQQSMQKTLEDFTKNVGPLNKIAEEANGAFSTNQFMNLGGIQNITGMLGKFGSKGGGGGGGNQGGGQGGGAASGSVGYTPPYIPGKLTGTFAANSYNTTKTLDNVSYLMTILGANNITSDTGTV